MNIFSLLGRYKFKYLVGGVLLVATNLLGAYIPQLIKEAVNLLQSFELSQSFNAVLQACMWIMGLALVMAATRVGSRQIIFGIGREVEFDLKKIIFNHVVSLEPAYFIEKRTGDLISIITNDVQSLRALFGFAFLNVLNTIISFIVIIPIIYSLEPELTISLMVMIPLILVFIVFLSNNIKKFQKNVQERLAEMSTFIEENLSGIHIIKTYAQEEAELARFKQYNQNLLGDYISLVQTRSLIGPVMRIIASIGFILLLFYGGRSVVAGNFSLGDFAAYSLYIQRLIWPIATLGWIVTVIFRAQVSIKRIDSILQVQPKIKEKDSAISLENFSQSIKISELNTEIKQGSVVGIVGKIGSGKSTLARKLTHLEVLQPGEIFMDDYDLNDISLESLRKLICLVPQTSFLFSTSIAENISFGADLNQEQIESLAKLVQIDKEIESFAEGYQTVVGEKGVTLSGGQRQRITIARSLALNSEILILDDSLSNLDTDTGLKLWRAILDYRRTKTTILITHKKELLNDCNQVIELKGDFLAAV